MKIDVGFKYCQSYCFPWIPFITDWSLGRITLDSWLRRTARPPSSATCYGWQRMSTARTWGCGCSLRLPRVTAAHSKMTTLLLNKIVRGFYFRLYARKVCWYNKVACKMCLNYFIAWKIAHTYIFNWLYFEARWILKLKKKHFSLNLFFCYRPIHKPARKWCSCHSYRSICGCVWYRSYSHHHSCHSMESQVQGEKAAEIWKASVHSLLS